MMKLGLTLASAALALVTLSSSTRAVEVLPGQNAVTATQITLGTFQTIDTIQSGFSASTGTGPAFSGTFTSLVVQEGSNNPLGGLTFLYDFSNLGPNTIRRLTTTGFAGFRTDVNYDGAGPIAGNTPPVGFDRSTTASDNGNVVGFDFTNGAQAGVVANGGSSYLVIRTNALGYRYTGQVSIIDGGTATINAFSATAVPEPGTMVAALVGLTAIGGLRLRRRTK